MPVYEYRCEKCGEFEHAQRITDPALQRCPTCKRKVRRLISNTSFQLKGSGWYVTDYARSGGGKDKEEKKDGAGEKVSSTGDSDSSNSPSESTKSETPKADGPKADGPKPANGKPARGKPARASA